MTEPTLIFVLIHFSSFVSFIIVTRSKIMVGLGLSMNLETSGAVKGDRTDGGRGVRNRLAAWDCRR